MTPEPKQEELLSPSSPVKSVNATMNKDELIEMARRLVSAKNEREIFEMLSESPYLARSIHKHINVTQLKNEEEGVDRLETIKSAVRNFSHSLE
jgi:hypothetical protein